jgi:hypothetical protein
MMPPLPSGRQRAPSISKMTPTPLGGGINVENDSARYTNNFNMHQNSGQNNLNNTPFQIPLSLSSSYLVGDAYTPTASPAKTAPPNPAVMPITTSMRPPLAPSGSSRETVSVSGSSKESVSEKGAAKPATPGIVGKARKSLLNWLYPDAHDASGNMGGSLDAYFDKDTGKWVIPGEVYMCI